MKTFFTHTHVLLRPPGRNTLSLLPFLLLLLLPALSVAQVNCFNGFNAGDNTTYCEGETATLNGGYGSYGEVDNDPNLGTPNLVWTVVSGTGTFEFDGVTGPSASSINFNNTETSTTGFPDVFFTPDAGVTEVVLRLNGLTSDGPCSGVNEVEEVTLYFDPIQDSPIDAFINDTQVLDSGDATTTNTVTAETGDVLDLFIDETFVIDNGQQYDDIRLYTVTYSGPGGFIGLPAAGTYDQNEFEVAFNNLTLTNTGCDVGSMTLNINAFYDRDLTTVPQPSGPCPGPVTEVEINVNPRPEPTATIGAVDDILIVCEDDEDVEIVVTGTPHTQVTYTVSYDGGATVPAGPLTLDLDATGTSFAIMLDANDGDPGEDIVVTLIEQKFSSGPPCPVTISKPLTIQLEPLPQLTISLLNAEDAVICNANNGGPTTVDLVLSTTSGVGSYTYTSQEFADGVLVFTNPPITRFFSDPDNDGIATATTTFAFGGPVPDGTVMTYLIMGTSIVKNDQDPDCVNDAPDTEVSILIQKESYVVAEINDSEGGTITLSDYFGSDEGDVVDAEVTFCDGETFTLNVIDPTTNNAFADIIGSEALLQVGIGDHDGLISDGGASIGIYNFTDNTFSVNEVLDIPNSQTTPSTFNIFLTPFMDNDGDGLYNDGGSTDDCLGNTVSVTVNVLPAPTVTVEVSADDVCEGQTVTVTITAYETGTASLILDQGGDPILVDIDHDNGDGTYSGTYMSDPLDGLTMFTVTTFIGDDADCSATVNQMVMTDVEPLPEASVAADISVCHDDDATITFTGTEGNGTGFTFNYSISSNGGTPASGSVSTDGTDATVDVTFAAGDLPAGGTTISLISVANKGGLECVNDAEGNVTISVEDEPIVSCDADYELICSGDDYSFTLTAGSAEESAIGNTLYYSVTTTVTTTVSTGSGSTEVPVVSTEIVLGDAGGVTISGPTENMSGFNQTVEISVTPFYFDDEVDEPTEIGGACTGETVTCSVTVKTMPMVTFGGDEAVCEGGSGTLVFTGPPGGRALVLITDSEGSTDLGFFFFTAGGSLFVPYEDADVTTTVTLIGVSDGPVLNPNTCLALGDFNFTINVTPSPEAEFDAEGETVCEGDSPSIALSGTPNAVATISTDDGGTDYDFDVALDGDGNGSFEATEADEDVTYTILTISITQLDGNGDEFTCTSDGGDEFELTVNPAPTGALVSNAVLCEGDSPEIQFNLTTENDDLTGSFDIVVNGITFEDVINGEVLDFAGTAFATLSVSTPFTLTSIVESDTDLACVDIIDGDISVEMVIVNEVPVVTISSVPDVICSGDALAITSSSTPTIGANGNVLFYELTLNDGVGAPPMDPIVTLISAAEVDAGGLNDALGLPGEFVNGSTMDPDNISFSVRPYYESNPDDPFGTEGCGEVMSGFGTNGFAAADWDVSHTTDAGEVGFTATEITLTLVDTDNDGVPGNGNDDNNFDRADARYSVTGTGLLSFDFEYDINDQLFGAPLDFFVVGFEGQVIFRNFVTTEGQFTTSGDGLSVTPGDEIIFQLRDILNRRLDEQFANSTATISNFAFTPSCQPCPGQVVEVDFDILPALFADFSSVTDLVCEGDDAEICILGTPDATVTVFFNGIYNDVKLDEYGNGCFTTVGGLTEDTDFLILGITTLDDMPQCSFTFEDGLWPVAPVTVIPAPSATISLEPTIVCAGDEVSAAVTGTANSTVTYTYNNVEDEVYLDAHGNGFIPLPTTNTGTANIVCHIILISIAVDVEGVICTSPLDDSVTLTVRPLPNGTISAGPAVCAGEQGTLSFTADPDLLGDYSIVVLDPNEVELTLTGTSGGTFLSTTIPGTYTLLSITDGTGTDIGCTRTGEDLGTAEVIIEEVPDLTAAVTGTVGTANLDSESPIFNTFRALVCDEGTINVDFGSSTEEAQAMGELMINVEVLANDDDQVNVDPVGTIVIPFDQLNSGDFLDGILENVADLDITSIEVILTPFFENGADAGALEAEDCAGGTLSFFIDITPAVMLEVDTDASTLVVCEGDAVSISLTGTPGAEVSFSSDNIDLDEAFEGGMVDLDENGDATITGTAGEAGTASLTVDVVMVTFIEGNISRQCMLMDADEVEILINEVPSAELSVDPAGPICNGENVDVTITLGEGEADGDYTVIINGEEYDVTISGGAAVVFNSGALTASTTFVLTSITNDETTCSNTGALSSAAILVEQIPTGEVIVTIDGEKTTVNDGVAAEFQICANERVDLYARNTNEGEMNSFASSLDSGDPVFNRPSRNSTAMDCEAADGTNDIEDAGLNVYYETYDFTIDVAGTYTFMMGNSPDLDDFLALYEGGFDPNDVCANFLAQDDDDGDGLESEIMIMLTLAPGSYTLVATSFDNLEEGGYVISYGGNDGGTITGLPNTGLGMETFSATFDGSDASFSRPNGGATPSSCSTSGNEYYDAYNFTIDVADTYTFMMGNSPDVDDFLVLYEGGFDPNDACTNLLEVDDDGGAGLESEIMIVLTLVPGDYTLVATSFGDLEEGDYEIKYGSANDGVICGLPTGGDPLEGDDYVSVDFSISEDIDFYGLGQSGTIALPIEDFGDQFSREYNMISGAPVTITLAVTYYNENGEVIGLDLDEECVGITDNITIVINPNPKTEDVSDMVCSGEALDYDLDDAITNGVVGATFSYTVASDDVDVSGLDRTVASDANVTDVFDNFSADNYTVTYTVTPFGTDGDMDCQGNDFELVVTIKPEPVITDDLTVEVCSGAPTACVVRLDNEGENEEAFFMNSTFELTNIVYSLEGPDFILADHNEVVGSVGDYQFIAHDVFTNLSSEPQTVTYTIVPTSADGCIGDPNTIVVTILPEAVVADMVMKVCSGGTIDLGFDELTVNGVGNILSFRRSTLPLTTLRVFDENREDVTLATFAGNSYSNAGITAIQDSFLNQGTATLSVFYDVYIEVTGETGDEGGPLTCEASYFTLEVQVVEEVDVVLEPINGQTAICAGEPITLVATYDGSGNEQSFEYSYVSDDGVVLELTPSAAGGEVTVDAASGMGNATVMVMVTDDNSCWAMATRVVSVGTTPEVMDIVGFEDPCVDDFSFYGITPSEGSTYEWSISNPAAGTFTNMPATGPNVSIAFNDSQGFGPFDVMVTETSAAGCSTTSSMTVSLSSQTTADFAADEDTADPLTFNFTELAGGGVEAYIWNFGDGVGTSNEQNPSYTYSPADPSAMETYTVTLTVLGCSGPVSTSKEVTINSTLESDVIELFQGINFISFDVAPEDNRFDAIFSGVAGVRRITTVDDGAASFYQPGAGPFNSLQTAEPGFGYVVIMDNDATLTISGEPIDDSFVRPMGMGINYMAFVPDGQMAAPDFWAPFEGSADFKLARTFGNNVTPTVQSYFPGFGPFNSMQNTYNGVGYLVLHRDDAASRDQQSSEDYEFVYGTVSGVDYTPGDRIEVLNQGGDVIGHLSPDQSGLFKATPLYGMVEGEDGVVMGAVEEGEQISFRYQGQVIDAGVSFQGEFAATELNLDFSNAVTTDKLTLRVQPNPAKEWTNLVLQLTASTDLSVEAVDATGRVVRTLLPRQTLSAGTTTIEWDDLNQFPAGMYHILVIRDGRIDANLTQRLVKH